MRKMILMAIAGFLWKKYKAHNATNAPNATGRGPATAATTTPSARP
ncbi:hypothetical protein LJR118_003209 [Acidovorax sp. LjRoot118]|nr:hypothetical protein [Acidovorax sp. Root219]